MYDQENQCLYLCRNKLVHAVIWPKGENPRIALIDTDGVEQSVLTITEPVKGQHYSNMLPEGYHLEVQDCHVVSMSGKLVIATPVPFDTAVVTERAELTFEERLERMERRSIRAEQERARREREREREVEALRQQLAEREREEAAPVIEEPEETPSDNQKEGEQDGE